jgi:hypothetical protein
MNHKSFICMVVSLAAMLSGASEKPAWATHSYGMESLSPDYTEPGGRFKPLQCAGNSITTGLHLIKIGDNGLPSVIQAKGQDILSAPVKIELSEAGGAIALTPEARSLAKNGKNSIYGKTVQHASGLKVETEVQMDYDYTMIFTITLVPLKKITLNKFALVFPMNLPDDRLLHATLEPENKLEAGINAQRRRITRCIKGKEPVKLNAWNNCWLGNTHYGLGWSFESVRNWNSVPGEEMIFTPADNLFSINLINRDTEISGPVSYRFYLSPTPQNTLPKDWRGWSFGTRYNNLTKLKPDKLIYWSFWRIGAVAIYNNEWVWDPVQLKKIADFDAPQGKNRMAYFIPSHFTHSTYAEKDGKNYVFTDPYLKKIAEENVYEPDRSVKATIPADAIVIQDLSEWRRLFNGQVPATKRSPETVAAPIPELVNQRLHSVHTFVNEYNIPGIYSDGNVPMPNFRITGETAAVKDHEGKIRPYFAVDAYRGMYKRARAIIRKADPVNGLLTAHNSGVRFPATLSFFDFIIYGETDFYWYQEPEKRDASTNGDFYYAHIWGDIDHYKVHFPRQWGMPQVLLPELRGRDRKLFPAPARGTRTMLSYTIQFDQHYWPVWCDVQEVNKFNAIRQGFGLVDTDREIVEFVPYWENKEFKPNHENLKVGYYEKMIQHDPYFPEAPEKRYLVLVSNIQFGDADAILTLPKELKKAKVIDRQAGTPMEIKNNTISFKLAPYDFAVFDVTGEKE